MYIYTAPPKCACLVVCSTVFYISGVNQCQIINSCHIYCLSPDPSGLVQFATNLLYLNWHCVIFFRKRHILSNINKK